MNLDLAKTADRVLGSVFGRVLGWGDRLLEVVRPPRPVPSVDRILVIKFWGLGNWALLRPIVQDLRTRWPRAHLTVATLSSNAPLVRDLCDELLLVRPGSLRHTLLDLARAVRCLRRRPPDLALDFEQFARSGALLARLGRAAQRVGFRTGNPGRDGLYTVTVARGTAVHAARSFRDLAEAAGIAPAEPRLGGLEASDAGRRACAALGVRMPYVVLHPGSGDNFPGRRWPTGAFAAVGRAAQAVGRMVVVTGGSAEAQLVDDVVAGIPPGPSGPGALGLAGRLSVEALVALLDAADVLVANDTGPVHIASQLSTPVLALYGPNTPLQYGPRSPGSRAFFRDLPCSPCIRASNYRTSRCRIFTCMASIPTGEVATALRTRLAEHDRRLAGRETP